MAYTLLRPIIATYEVCSTERWTLRTLAASQRLDWRFQQVPVHQIIVFTATHVSPTTIVLNPTRQHQ